MARCNGRVYVGVIFADVPQFVWLLPVGERASVFPKVYRVKMITRVGQAFGFLILKEVVVVAVDIKYGGAVAAIGAVAHHGRAYRA